MATPDSEPVARLPFHFDTAGVVTTIMRGVAALLCVLAAGALYSLFVQHRIGSATALLAIGVGVVWFGRSVLSNLEGTHGVITREAIVVQPGGVYGMRMAGPAGTFPMATIKEVR